MYTLTEVETPVSSYKRQPSTTADLLRGRAGLHAEAGPEALVRGAAPVAEEDEGGAGRRGEAGVLAELERAGPVRRTPRKARRASFGPLESS